MLLKLSQIWTLVPMSFDMLGTFHFISLHVAGSHLTRTCCWQLCAHISPLPTPGALQLQVTETTAPAASARCIRLELVEQLVASENPKHVKGAASLSRRGLELPISCS